MESGAGECSSAPPGGQLRSKGGAMRGSTYELVHLTLLVRLQIKYYTAPPMELGFQINNEGFFSTSLSREIFETDLY